MVRITGIAWDGWNIEHIKKHKINPEEVGESLEKTLKSYQTHGGRILTIGKTKTGRLLTVILAPKGKGKYYLVTARDTSNKERKLLK